MSMDSVSSFGDTGFGDRADPDLQEAHPGLAWARAYDQIKAQYPKLSDEAITEAANRAANFANAEPPAQGSLAVYYSLTS